LNDLLIGHSSKKTFKTSKKKIPFTWGIEHQEAFESIRNKLIQPPILAYANYNLPFKVHTDASSTGLGAVIYQKQGGLDRVIAYASRSLKPAERNYPAHKLEFLALKWAVTEKFSDYLYGCRFELWTDNPLTYVQTTAKLDATGHRWLAALSNYDLSILYRSGAKNIDADRLSRIHQNVVKASICAASVDHHQSPLAFSTIDPQNLPAVESTVQIPKDVLEGSSLTTKDWKKAQEQDEMIALVITHLKRGSRPRDTRSTTLHRPSVLKFLREWDKLVLRDDVLYRRGKVSDTEFLQLILPEQLRSDIFKALHDDLGHQGRDRTISLFKERFFWPGMDVWIDEKVKQCERCVRRKSLPSNAKMVNIKSSAPMEILCIDFLSLEQSKGGFENILVVTDHFSRYAQAFPTKNQLARTTAKVLFDQYIVHYGFPARIHSDQGPNFESQLIKEFMSWQE